MACRSLWQEHARDCTHWYAQRIRPPSALPSGGRFLAHALPTDCDTHLHGLPGSGKTLAYLIPVACLIATNAAALRHGKVRHNTVDSPLFHECFGQLFNGTYNERFFIFYIL
jgi:hypothetical protein